MARTMLSLLLTAGLAWTATAKVCPGYKASNVHTTDTGMTASLTLAGTPCDVYGTDLKDLALTVEYQTGK